MPLVSIREALADPELLGDALPGDSWLPWRVLLIAAMGEALTDEERALFKTLTGREREPGQMVEELWGIVGRRGGKTRAAGTLAAYIGALCDHSGYLASGERGVLPILAASQTQATRAFQHAHGILDHSPILAQQLDEATSGIIRLKTRVDIEIRPASFRTIRGITAVAVICDEVAFWQAEGGGSLNPDTEIMNAVRPALGTTGGPLMVISSPYAKRGEVYAAYKRDYGPDGDPLILIAKAPTRVFNSTFPQRLVDRAYQKDAAAAAAEYGGEFRNDLEAYVSREAVEACVSKDVQERRALPGITYFAFVDPSGGGADSMTLAIGHRLVRDCRADESDDEEVIAVIDVLCEQKPDPSLPFSPEAVVKGFAQVMKEYRVTEVYGDRYGGEWPREVFRRYGVTYLTADQFKSALYQDLLPVINSGRLDLLDDDRAVSQIASLERRVASGGREIIDHPRGSHDDVANVIAGVVGLCLRKPPPYSGPLCTTYGYGWDDPDDDYPPPAWLLEPGNEDRLREYRARRRDRGGTR